MAPPEPLPYVPPLPQVWSPISKYTVPERASEATASNCRRIRWAAEKRSLLSAFFLPSAVVLVNEVALTAGEADEPLALSLEINSTGAGGRAEHEAGCEKECHKFFHEWFPSYKNCVILVRGSNV
jgi:hypothetical protein